MDRSKLIEAAKKIVLEYEEQEVYLSIQPGKDTDDSEYFLLYTAALQFLNRYE